MALAPGNTRIGVVVSRKQLAKLRHKAVDANLTLSKYLVRAGSVVKKKDLKESTNILKLCQARD